MYHGYIFHLFVSQIFHYFIRIGDLRFVMNLLIDAKVDFLSD